MHMIYSGYFRPFESPFANTMDLLNETLTLMCSYSLIMFSEFVPSPETRSLCGWQLIGLVLITLVINLSVIITQGIKNCIRKCKLKAKRRKAKKLAKKRTKDHLRQQKNMHVAQDIIEKDGFYHLDGFGPLARFNSQAENQQT